MTYANCIKDSKNDTSRKRERCMLLFLMPLFRLDYLLLFIRFPSVAYQESRRSNTLHNEDIKANFFSCSFLYRDFFAYSSSLFSSRFRKQEKRSHYHLSSFSVDLHRVSSSILVCLLFICQYYRVYFLCLDNQTTL
jgi:hypothetical protein